MEDRLLKVMLAIALGCIAGAPPGGVLAIAAQAHGQPFWSQLLGFLSPIALSAAIFFLLIRRYL